MFHANHVQVNLEQSKAALSNLKTRAHLQPQVHDAACFKAMPDVTRRLWAPSRGRKGTATKLQCSPLLTPLSTCGLCSVKSSKLNTLHSSQTSFRYPSLAERLLLASELSAHPSSIVRTVTQSDCIGHTHEHVVTARLASHGSGRGTGSAAAGGLALEV